MIDFEYVRAADVDAAIRAAAAPRARYVAGGTTLVDLMRLDVERPEQLVDLNGLRAGGDSLGTVTPLPGGGLRLGALAHMSDAAWDARLRDGYPLVSQSLLLAASGQIRNMATLGGNVLQRTRCPYFRDTATPCNKREPGSGCSAIGGVTRMHAVLGTSAHCIAAHPSDFAVALAALDATVHVRGVSMPGGAPVDRTIPFTSLHTLPGQHPERETVLRAGDLITAIDLPPLPYAKRSLYLKVRDRASYAFALASAAVAVDVQGGTIREARVALGGVGAKPWRSHEAERALSGRRVGPDAFRAAAEAALVGATPHGENAFKIELARRTLIRALTEVTA